MIRLFLKKHYFQLIGLAIFLYIIFGRLDWSQIIPIFRQTSWLLLFIAILLSLVMLLFQSWRWNYLKKIQKINFTFFDSFLLYGAGVFWGLATPGKLGDLIKIKYLGSAGQTHGKAAVSVLADRLLDVSFLLIMGYIGMLFFANILSQQIIVITLLILIPLILLAVIRKIAGKGWLLKKIYQLLPSKYQSFFKDNFHEFKTDWENISINNWLTLILMTILCWMVYYLQLYFIARSIGLTELSPLFLALASTISALVAIIPISIMGIGTRDATLLLLFSFASVSSEKTIIFSTLILVLNVGIGIIGYYCWLNRPLGLITKHNS